MAGATGVGGSAAELDERRKRLRYRAWRRGTRELDLIVGGYVDAKFAELDLGAIERIEMLLSESENDLMEWLTGRAPVPAEVDAALIGELVRFKEGVGR